MWLNHLCPSCGLILWWWDDDGTDSSQLDIGSVKCWSCGKTIVLFDGQDQDEYRPHVEGESKWDDQDHGRHRDAVPSPADCFK